MLVSEWIDEVDCARKREKDWREDGQEILDIYENEEDSPFNILYSNTETLSPALFSQLPRPVVTRRHKEEDPLGRVVSEASQRMLEYLIDTDIEDYDTFDGSVKDAVLDGLLPGRGVTSIKYESSEDVSWETVCADSRKWDRVYYGFAHKWKRVPWIAYEEYLDKKEAKELFGSKAGKLEFTEGEEPDENESSNEDERNRGKRKTACVYQIWDKERREIIYVSPQDRKTLLRKDEDPLGLTGFFNCPKPITFVRKSNNLKPTALYTLYENQAEELNKIQRRINKIVSAIKVRGAYNGAMGEEIENILKDEDNALVPTDKAAALMEGGFDKNIWLLPLGELIGVLQQLMQARESAKRVIYEITGISDIVRGQSVASETLGAQKIKESWGTMRLKDLQKEVQRYVLDMMKLMLDVAANKFSEKSWAAMTGLPYATTEQVEKAQGMMHAAQQALQSGVDPQTVPPQIKQQFEQAQKILQGPKWPEIIKAMQDDFARSYRVDIETNSTLDVEATEDKALVGDFMNAMAQFMNGIGPLIESGVMPFGAAKSMMLSIVKRFRFGREVEDELKAMQEPKQKPNPEQEKAVKEFQKAKEDFNKQKQQAEEQLTQEANKLREDKMQLEFDKKLAKMELDFEAKLKEAQGQLNEAEAENALKDMIENHKRDVQSMLDKHMANVQSCMSKAA